MKYFVFLVESVPEPGDGRVYRPECIIKMTKAAFGAVCLQDSEFSGTGDTLQCFQPVLMGFDCIVQAVQDNLVVQHVKGIFCHISHDFCRFIQLLFNCFGGFYKFCDGLAGAGKRTGVVLQALTLFIYMLHLIIQFVHGAADFFTDSGQSRNGIGDAVHAGPVLSGDFPDIPDRIVDMLQFSYGGIHTVGTFVGGNLNIIYEYAHASGQRFGLICKFPYFISHNGKTSAGFSGAGGFYGSV